VTLVVTPSVVIPLTTKLSRFAFPVAGTPVRPEPLPTKLCAVMIPVYVALPLGDNVIPTPVTSFTSPTSTPVLAVTQPTESIFATST